VVRYPLSMRYKHCELTDTDTAVLISGDSMSQRSLRSDAAADDDDAGANDDDDDDEDDTQHNNAMLDESAATASIKHSKYTWPLLCKY